MSIVDLFNPSFLMFLAILVLVSALIVVYFESKMREQNHKIASMLSIVSSVAEELNYVKSSFSQNGGTINSNNIPNVIELNSSMSNNFETIKKMDLDTPLNLIEVSDDEDEDEDEYESEEEEYEDELDLEDDDEELEELDEEFDLDNDADINDEAEELDLEDAEDLDNHAADIKNDIKVLKLDNEIEAEEIDISNIDLKSIKFDNSLEEKKEPDISEYKKLPVNKLKSIAIEKGIIDESSKLKKPELLKLLGVHF
jgi:hypothetical protein